MVPNLHLGQEFLHLGEYNFLGISRKSISGLASPGEHANFHICWIPLTAEILRDPRRGCLPTIFRSYMGFLVLYLDQNFPNLPAAAVEIF